MFPHKLLKRETSFGQCKGVPPVLTVKISPDPVVPGSPDTFTVSGTLENDIPESAQLMGFFSDPNTGKIIGDTTKKPVCEDSKCPKANIPFTLTLDISEVPELPTTYDIVVGIVIKITVLTCAAARVGQDSLSPLSYNF